MHKLCAVTCTTWAATDVLVTRTIRSDLQVTSATDVPPNCEFAPTEDIIGDTVLQVVKQFQLGQDEIQPAGDQPPTSSAACGASALVEEASARFTAVDLRVQ